MQRIAVCEVQVPFVRGGAEYLVRALVDQLLRQGYHAELVSIPFKWYPREELLSSAAAWRLVDLSESNGQTIDLVIGSKFPSYFVRHPNKVTWLVHQHRAAYDLCGTPYSDFGHVEADIALRETLLRLDREMLQECRRLYTIGRKISDRLEQFNALQAPPLYHPPRLASQLRSGPYGDYVLFVGRLETIKRPDLAIRAMLAVDRPIRLLVVGDGSQRTAIAQLAGSLGVSDRVEFLGSTGDEDLVNLYRGALAVIYTPYDEDYGYVTLESFLASKPVVTASDSGGPLEFVEDGVTGLVCDPDPVEIATAVNRLAADRRLAASLGASGHERASMITWDGVIEKLVE